MGRKKVGPLTPWEIAKPLLEQDVINRDVTDDMPPRQVKQMRDEYKNCGKSFGSNYRRLQKSIRQHKSRAFKDASAYNHDKQLKTLARYDPNCWEGSEAKALLAEDIKDEMHGLLASRISLWRPNTPIIVVVNFQVAVSITLDRLNSSIVNLLYQRLEVAGMLDLFIDRDNFT